MTIIHFRCSKLSIAKIQVQTYLLPPSDEYVSFRLDNVRDSSRSTLITKAVLLRDFFQEGALSSFSLRHHYFKLQDFFLCRKEIMNVKLEHIRCSRVSTIETRKSIFAYIIKFKKISVFCCMHLLVQPCRQGDREME